MLLENDNLSSRVNCNKSYLVVGGAFAVCGLAEIAFNPRPTSLQTNVDRGM